MSGAGAKSFGKYGIDPLSRAVGIEPASAGGAVGRAADDALGTDPNKNKDEIGAEVAPGDAKIEDRTKEFETRKQVAGRVAAAAGATRSANEADLLGYATPRRKSASRTLLG